MLEYIEELFKSEELVKNKNLINALLYHADVYRNPKSHPTAKARAKEAIKQIGEGKMPSQQVAAKKVKKRPEAGPRVIKDPPATEVKGVGIPQYQHHFKHYNVTPEMWKQHSEIHKPTMDFHNEVMAGKHPEYAHVRTAMGEQKMKKSLENILESVKTIRANLTQPKQVN